METTGDRIKLYRRDRNLTQGELGDLVGLSATAIMRYEKNMREPKARASRAIADALGVSEAYLLCQTDDPTPEALKTAKEVAQNRRNDIFSQRALQLLESLKAEEKYLPEWDSYYDKLKDGDLTLVEKVGISNTLSMLCNVTSDYLFGFVDVPDGHISSIPPEYSDVASGIIDADTDLLNAVHKICGMNTSLIADDIVTGTLSSTWNPKKIEIVKNYIIKNEDAIIALIYRMGRDTSSNG